MNGGESPVGRSSGGSGWILVFVLLLLCSAVVAGLALQSCENRADLDELKDENKALRDSKDDDARARADLIDERSQLRIKVAELTESSARSAAEAKRLGEQLAAARRDLERTRAERDRYLDDLVKTSRSNEDALNELARLAPLEGRLRDLEATEADRRRRLEDMSRKAKELLGRLEEIRAELDRQGE